MEGHWKKAERGKFEEEQDVERTGKAVCAGNKGCLNALFRVLGNRLSQRIQQTAFQASVLRRSNASTIPSNTSELAHRAPKANLQAFF